METIEVLNSHSADRGGDDGSKLVAAAPYEVASLPSVGIQRGARSQSEATKRVQPDRWQDIWGRTEPARNTLVHDYLFSQGLTNPPPEDLRFLPRLRHPSGATFPAMIALVRRSNCATAMGIHGTFLATNGSSTAPITPLCMTLGPTISGAVRLAAPQDVLIIGIDIEECLTAMQNSGIPAWATLCSYAMCRLHVPRAVRHLILLGDADDADDVQMAAVRWREKGHIVAIAAELVLHRTQAQRV